MGFDQCKLAQAISSAGTLAQGALKGQKLEERVMASNTPHSLATEHLPMFISGPGETDVFFIAVVVIVILAIMVIGALYFTLHALPEKLAHRTNNNQILLISVMLLVALFTHNNYFFIGALLLATVRLPDWSTPLNSIAKSLEDQANKNQVEASADSHQGVEPPVVAPAPENSDSAEQLKAN